MATIAFGMGVDCKGLHRTVHFGPSKNIEAFIQETGRAGRDGVQSLSYLLYHGLLLTHVCQDIREYVKLKDCRRRCLLKHFAYDETATPVIPHLCCDNCAQACKCGLPDCGKYLITYSSVLPSHDSPGTERNVTMEQKTELLKLLTNYHKSLVMKFLSEHAQGDVKTLTNLPLLIGFSDVQISQVVDNCNKLFTMDDVYKRIEIWHSRHAKMILTFVKSVFMVILEPSEVQTANFDMETYDDSDDELDFSLNTEWDAIIKDDDFVGLLCESFEVEELSGYCSDASSISSEHSNNDIPSAVLELLENVIFND